MFAIGLLVKILNKFHFFFNCLYSNLDYIHGNHGNSEVILVGDFNDRCSEWYSDHTDSELNLKLFDLINSFGLTQLISEPTRGKNILDLMIVKNVDSFLDCIVGDPFDELDHCPIIGVLNARVKKLNCYKRQVRSYNENNLSHLSENLRNVPWHVLLNSDCDIDDMVNLYTKIIQDEITLCIPSREVLIRPYDKPGMTSTVRSLFRRCNRFHKIAQRTKLPIDIENHKISRKIAKQSWKCAKNEYLQKLSNKIVNPSLRQKSFWNLMKNLKGSKHLSIPCLIKDEIKYESNIEKCEILNDYFVMQTKLNFEMEPSLPELIPRSIKYLSDIVVTNSDVLNILKSLNVTKANGPDNIGNLILKQNAEVLSEPITLLINNSLRKSVFPSEWKKANVTPVFKKGSRQDYKNYRPISLLSNTSKILERVVYNHLYEHCAENHLLSENNSGF